MQPDSRLSADHTPESLEARLRALPQPPVPGDLEARLLAKTPGKIPFSRPRWANWRAVTGGLVAACVAAAMLVWWIGQRHEGNQMFQPPQPTTHDDSPVALGPAKVNAIASWQTTRRVLEGAELPAFTWPVEEKPPMTVSTSIPADLLD